MTVNVFEQLRRDARARGFRDYCRERDNAAHTGESIFRNNPHQNNHATDERECWDEGWDDAANLDARGEL